MKIAPKTISSGNVGFLKIPKKAKAKHSLNIFKLPSPPIFFLYFFYASKPIKNNGSA